MKKKKLKFGLSLVLALALVVLVLASLPLAPYEPSAAEAGFPTPQCCSFGGGDWSMVTYMDEVEIVTTTKTCGNSQQTAAYVLADMQSLITMPTSNTITCTMEFSNDNVNWCTDVHNINSALIITTTACDEFNLFGRYSRVCCQTPNDAITVTVSQRAKVFN